MPTQKFFTVYKITHLPTGKFYIGRHVTSNLQDSYMGSGKIIKTLPFVELKKEILVLCENFEEMNRIEHELIRNYYGTEVCLNVAPRSGGGVSQHSEETKKRMKENAGRPWLGKTRTFSVEQKKNMAAGRIGNKNAGGLVHTKEFRQAASERIKGDNNPNRKNPPVGDKNPMYGKLRPDNIIRNVLNNPSKIKICCVRCHKITIRGALRFHKECHA